MQYLLGAGVVGVLFTQIATTVRDSLARRRERNGLLRILFTEASTNHRSIEFLLFSLRSMKKGEVVAVIQETNVLTDTWEAARVKLAEHLSGNEFGPLAHYYKNLAILEEITNRPDVSDDPTLNAVRMLVNRLDEQGIEVQRIIRRYVSDISVDELSEEDVKRLERGRSLGELLEEDR